MERYYNNILISLLVVIEDLQLPARSVTSVHSNARDITDQHNPWISFMWETPFPLISKIRLTGYSDKRIYFDVHYVDLLKGDRLESGRYYDHSSLLKIIVENSRKSINKSNTDTKLTISDKGDPTS